MKREDGFYWVKIDGSLTVGRWTNTGRVFAGYWALCGNDFDFHDNELDEIGEQIKKPDI